MRGLIFSAALAAAALGGCYVADSPGYNATYSGQATVAPSGGAYAAPSGDAYAAPSGDAYAAPGADGYAATPDLVAVSPGVQVVADYDEPVFFSDGFYWRYYDGGWYRSYNYSTGWFFVAEPPLVIARIDRPYAYAHYRPAGYVARTGVRYRPPETIVRGRTYQPGAAVRGSTYVGPAVRNAPPAAAPPGYRGAPPAAAPPGYRSAPPAAAPPGYRGAPPAAAPPGRAPAAAPPPAAAPARRAPAPKGETRDHRH